MQRFCSDSNFSSFLHVAWRLNALPKDMQSDPSAVNTALGLALAVAVWSENQAAFHRIFKFATGWIALVGGDIKKMKDFMARILLVPGDQTTFSLWSSDESESTSPFYLDTPAPDGWETSVLIDRIKQLPALYKTPDEVRFTFVSQTRPFDSPLCLGGIRQGSGAFVRS
jgi:hypothetical protein